MKDLNVMPGEHVSDLMDGRLSDDECARALQGVLSDPEVRKTWHAYHVVGDVLRSAELAPSHGDLAFLARLENSLAKEPVRPPAQEGVTGMVTKSVVPSANVAVFRWKMLAGMACTALLGVVGMSLWTQTGQPSDDLQMAVHVPAASPPAPPSVTTIVTAGTDAGPMLRDARLDELMAAHRQLGGHSALQVPAGFLRNATYEGTAR